MRKTSPVANATLLAAVLENPDDDAPRLAYAAWLKKNGNPDRAEFIRVQCKLSALDKFDPLRKGLEKKEKTLLNKHGERWKAELPEWCRKNAKFRRGFLAEVDVSPDTFVKHGADLVALTPLETLNLGGQDYFFKTVRELGKCPHAARLTELKLWSWDARDAAVKVVANSPTFARLRTFVTGPLITDRGIAALAATKYLTAITTLDLGSGRLTAAVVKALRNAPWKLDNLSLCNVPLGDAGAALVADSPGLASLTSLELGNCGIGPKGAKALAASPYLGNLRFLGLGHNRLTTEGVAAIADSSTLAGLEELHLMFGHLEDDAARALARARHLDHMKEMWTHCNEFSPEVQADMKRRFGDAVKL
jgi:uncharacterized protein (TIGR02996 family)